MSRPGNPVAQSVHDRLRRIAADRKEDFNGLLARYGAERFLYRLTRTRHGRRFVLKGAMLFLLWRNRLHRPTRDLDLLGSGDITEQTLRAIFTDACRARVRADGLAFDPNSMTVQEIREHQIYRGLRVRVRGLLGKARIDVQVDVGTGDAVTPEPLDADYPTLLDLPAPHLKAYPPETVVAEKLDAMVQLALRNSRMKDFFDLWWISNEFEFDGRTLAEAVRRTFERRATPLEPAPICLTDEFASDPSKETQWRAFIRRSRLSDAPVDFAHAIQQLRSFLHPLVSHLGAGEDFAMRWPAGGPWRQPTSR